MGSYLVAGTILSELEQSSILIVPSSLVGLTVGGVRWYRDAAARWRAHCARGSGEVVAREWQQAVSNLNPLRDHFCTICTVGEVIIKTPNICFALWVFYHLGSLGIYFDTMDPK